MVRLARSEREGGLTGYLASLVRKIGSTRFQRDSCLLVRQHFLDAIAAAFLGCREKPFTDLVRLCPRMAGGCGWPGSGTERVHPIDAGMLWSFAIHASVFEDGSREGACHPASAVIPAIIAFSRDKSWSTVYQAAIAGYDVMVRVARGGNPAFTRRGFHPTAITAPFGAAAAASLLLGNDQPATQSALCMAAMGCAGLMPSFRHGETQPLQVAWSVRSGLVAAMMASAGYSGYPRILEEGFYPAYLGNHSPLPLDKPLQSEYAIQGSYLKPYPGCRHLHPSIDALAEVLARAQIDPAQVERVKVRTYRIAVETEIETLSQRGDAYFNIPYAMAARLVLGRNDWDSFDQKHFGDRRLIAMMKKVRVQADPELDDLYPQQRSSIVEVYTADGSKHSARVRFPLGEPENPLPDSFLRDKFRGAAGAFLSGDSLDRLETMLHYSGPTEPPAMLFELTCQNIQPR